MGKMWSVRVVGMKIGMGIVIGAEGVGERGGEGVSKSPEYDKILKSYLISTGKGTVGCVVRPNYMAVNH